MDDGRKSRHAAGSGEKSGAHKAHSGGARYLVVAVEEERIRWIEDSFRKARLEPVICDVDVLAMINIFTQNYPEDAAEAAALVYLTGSQALVCLARKGNYVESDRVEPMRFDSTDTVRQSIKRIEDKVAELAAHTAPGHPGAEVKRCFLCGDAVADVRVRDQLLGAFTLPAEILNPFRSVLVAQEIKSQVLMVSPALAVVTGLTLRAPEGGRP
jgi:Tfp pilus assembly PilM family ATPase